MECGCEQHQGEGLGDDDNGTVPNCPIADVKDDDEVRTFFLILLKSKPILLTTSAAQVIMLEIRKIQSDAAIRNDGSRVLPEIRVFWKCHAAAENRFKVS